MRKVWQQKGVAGNLYDAVNVETVLTSDSKYFTLQHVRYVVYFVHAIDSHTCFLSCILQFFFASLFRSMALPRSKKYRHLKDAVRVSTSRLDSHGYHLQHGYQNFRGRRRSHSQVSMPKCFITVLRNNIFFCNVVCGVQMERL